MTNCKKILITGSEGFLGKHLVKHFVAKGYFVYEAHKRNFDKLEKYFFFPKLDYIIHCAVKTEAGSYCKEKCGEQFLINTDITQKILTFWKNIQPQAKFITFGSSCGYDPELIKIEDNYLNGDCEPGYETYGMIKRYLLQGLKALNQQYGMEYSYLIPSLIYGPGFILDDKHFIYDLIRKLIKANQTQEIPIFWGDGNQRRELIYIDDAINIIEQSLTWKEKIINLSPGFDYSIKQYIGIIQRIIGYEGEINWDKTAFVGAQSKHLWNTYLTDYKFIPPTTGLKNTIEYYLENEHK